MILIDSSAWIEYLRSTNSAVDQRVANLIATDALVSTSQPVNAELLSGARDDANELELRRMIDPLVMLPFDPVIDFDGAATIYRLCRRAGVTPRDLMDCAIAAVAIRHNAAVLAQDIDFARIASVVNLELDPATPR